jgi:hypothetical protein
MRDQLNDPDIRPILKEVEAGQHPKWTVTADRSPTYKGCSAQLKYLAVRDGIVNCHWESAEGECNVSQIVLPLRKVKDVLA